MRLMRISSKKPIMILVVVVALAAYAAFSFIGASVNKASANKIYEYKVVPADRIAEEVPRMDAEMAAIAKKGIKQMKTKGYVEVPDDFIPPRYSKDSPGIQSVGDIKTSFKVSMPSWLPKNTELIGALTSGEEIDGIWDGITIVYDSPRGQIHISQSKPRNGGGAVYSQELMTEKINGKSVSVYVQKGKNSKRRWTSIAWNSNGTEFVVDGEVPRGLLLKTSASIK